jgi:hypothetical protein
MRDDAISVVAEEDHLGVAGIGAQGHPCAKTTGRPVFQSL